MKDQTTDTVKLRESLELIGRFHRPADSDDRLCHAGCHGSWPCDTRLEADDALGTPTS